MVSKKIYYKIGEACRAVDVQPYVLRYWETEFAFLAPTKSKSGQRVYTEKELGLIRRIKELLYDEGYTIAGAKKRLEADLKDGKAPGDGSTAVAETVVEPVEEEVAAGAPLVDTAAPERVETLEQGVQRALEQVRGILQVLDDSDAG